MARLRLADSLGMVGHMRILASLATAAFLAACASAGPAPSSAPSAPETTIAPQSGSRAAQLLAAAGRDNAPTQADIERVFGRPDIARQDGAGAALTYRLEHCALLLLFRADGRNAMRLNEAHASARRAGEAAPTLEQCAAEVTARRS